jgi:DNA polymerase
MFRADDLCWIDFESAAALDLKGAGAFRYANDAATRAIVLAFAPGNAKAQAWHAGGEILDWDQAPNDLRQAFADGTVFAAWNAEFDAAIWNYAALGFPFLEPERIIDVMIQAAVSNLPADLESASTYLGGEGKQKDGKKLIKLFCVDGADPKGHPEEWQRFLSYAVQDIDAMRQVYRRTRPLPLKEWREYWAFERVNRRGVGLDMPFVRNAAALIIKDGAVINRALSELTGGAVTGVSQAKRIAAWLYKALPEAEMRELLIAPEDDDEIDDDDGAAIE